MSNQIVQLSHETMSIFMSFSLLCFSCSDHSNLKRMEFVNNASFMVFIVFLMEKKCLKEKKSMCTMIQKEITVPSVTLSAASTHITVWKKTTKKRVCPLSHIHIVVEFRSLAGGRTCLCSLCMAQTDWSVAARPDSKETWKEEEEKEEDLDWLSNTKR